MSSIYRDRAFRCPRCELDLLRLGDVDRWTCRKCSGIAVSTEELVNALVAVAPDLLEGRRAVDVHVVARRSREPALPCAACGQPMDAVFLGGEAVDRCVDDALTWFDGDELDRVLDRAAAQRDDRAGESRGWRARFRAWLRE